MDQAHLLRVHRQAEQRAFGPGLFAKVVPHFAGTVFSLENVARHIGACLAQHWNVQDIQHLRWWRGRFQDIQRLRNWSQEKCWRPDEVKAEYV